MMLSAKLFVTYRQLFSSYNQRTVDTKHIVKADLLEELCALSILHLEPLGVCDRQLSSGERPVPPSIADDCGGETLHFAWPVITESKKPLQ